jgi:serine/threonine protein kinase
LRKITQYPERTSLDRPKTPTDGAGRGTKSERPKDGAIALGTIIGRYTILEHLGSGGMASVYSAYDKQLERIVALKMLRAELEVDEVRTRMLREGQAMARLKHHSRSAWQGSSPTGGGIGLSFAGSATRGTRAWRRVEMPRAGASCGRPSNNPATSTLPTSPSEPSSDSINTPDVGRRRIAAWPKRR